MREANESFRKFFAHACFFMKLVKRLTFINILDSMMFGKQSLYLVLGGRLSVIGGSEFEDLKKLQLIGIFDSFSSAEVVWRAQSQSSVDDAAMCYRVVALHNIIAPTDTVAEFLAVQGVSEGLRLPKSTTVTETCRQMTSQRVSAALIVEEGRPIGIFTERDLVRLVVEAPHGWRDQPISDYMSPSPLVVSEDDLLIDALSKMQSGHFRHMPVVDLAGKLRHVISIRDFAFKDRF